MKVVGQVLATEHGSGLQMLICLCGDPQRGHGLLAPFRALGPLEDNIRVQPYGVTNSPSNPALSAAHFQTNLVVSRLSESVLVGGITRVGQRDTAFPLRHPCCELDIMGRWVTPAERLRAVEWVSSLRDSLRPLATGAYVNQLGETSEELVRAPYGRNYVRLTQIKKKYDPTNVLRLNQSVKPS